MRTKKLFLIMIAFIGVISIGFGGYHFGKKETSNNQRNISCPTAKLPPWTEIGYDFNVDYISEDERSYLTIKYPKNNMSSLIIPFSSSLFTGKSFDVFPSFYKGIVYHEYLLKKADNDSRFDSIYLERLSWSHREDIFDKSITIPDEYRGSFLGYENYSHTPYEQYPIDKNKPYINKIGLKFYWLNRGGPKTFEKPATCLITDYIKGDWVSDRFEVCKLTNKETNSTNIEKGLMEIADIIDHAGT